MHFRDFGSICRLLNIYLSHTYTYTYFRARKIKDTAATSSLGGLLHTGGKLAEVTEVLIQAASLFGIFLSRPGCWLGLVFLN